MKKNRILKKTLIFILAAIMTFSYSGLNIMADETEAYPEGLCEHHPEHTPECGYSEASEGHPCGHAHDETCGYEEEQTEVPCDMGCTDTDGDGVTDHVPECAYRPYREGHPCSHTHDEACGYVEAKEAAPCRFHCEICEGKETERAANEGAPEYIFDDESKTLTIRPGIYEGIGQEFLNQPDFKKWRDEVKKVIIDGDITHIGSITEDENDNWGGIFGRWTNLESVEYNGTDDFEVGDYAFWACPKLNSFPFEHVAAVGSAAFQQTALTEVVIPNLTGNIGDCAFWLVNTLENVRIDAKGNDTYIGNQAFAGENGSGSALKNVTVTGQGILRIGQKSADINKGKTFAYQNNLEVLDLSGFSGDVSFSIAAFMSDTNLKKIVMSPDSEISDVGYACFGGCVSLDHDFLNFSRITGTIQRAAFSIQNWGDGKGKGSLSYADITGLDLSNVKEIGAFAFSAEREFENYGYDKLTNVRLDNLERMHAFAFQGDKNVDWDSANIPETAKLAYSDTLTSSDTIWNRILALMDGKFTLRSDGYGEKSLEPSDNGWEDVKYGENNSTGNDSTQLTKSAKWVNHEKTEAELEIKAAYAPKEQMDFIFVLDTSTSMASWNDMDSDDADLLLPSSGGNAQYAKMYEMESKVADITEKLLGSEQIDSRVAIVGFGGKMNFMSEGTEKIGVSTFEKSGFSSPGFYTKEDIDKAISDIRNMPCKGSTHFYMGLWGAANFAEYDSNNGRDVTVIFLSDGEAMPGSSRSLEYLKSFTSYISDKDPQIGLGKDIFGVLYKSEPTEDEKKYINMACYGNTVFLADDTEGFSAAVNNAVYTALTQYSLTDIINENFEGISAEDISVSGGNFSVAEDGRTISWDLTGTEPYTPYSMTVRLKLAAQTDGEYPSGDILTNQGEMTIGNGTGDILNSADSPALKRGYGNLTISNEVTGNAGEPDREFNFTVNLSDTSVNGKFGDLTFENGAANFTLKHKESVTAADLPAGIAYEVIQTDGGQNGYTTKSSNESGNIPYEDFAYVSFINNKEAEKDPDEPNKPGVTDVPADPNKPVVTNVPDNLNSNANYAEPEKKAEAAQSDGSPLTGDAVDAIIWIVILGGMTAAALMLLIYAGKKHEDNAHDNDR